MTVTVTVLLHVWSGLAPEIRTVAFGSVGVAVIFAVVVPAGSVTDPFDTSIPFTIIGSLRVVTSDRGVVVA